MKKIIKLTENDLHRVIKESVKQVINEIEWKPRQKPRDWNNIKEKLLQDPNAEIPEYQGHIPEDWLSDQSWIYMADYNKQKNSGKKVDDPFGLETDMYKKYGVWDRHPETGTKRDPEGYDYYGYDKDGFDRKGRSRNGYDRRGFRVGDDVNKYTGTKYDKEGYSKSGYNNLGYNKDGYNNRGRHFLGFDPSNDSHGIDERKLVWFNGVDGYDRFIKITQMEPFTNNMTIPEQQQRIVESVVKLFRKHQDALFNSIDWVEEYVDEDNGDIKKRDHLFKEDIEYALRTCNIRNKGYYQVGPEIKNSELYKCYKRTLEFFGLVNCLAQTNFVKQAFYALDSEIFENWLEICVNYIGGEEANGLMTRYHKYASVRRSSRNRKRRR